MTMRRRSRPSWVASVALLVITSMALGRPAGAQLNGIAPTFGNLSGAAIWGSAGFGQGSKNGRPLFRETFAAFYGPFGGRGDTVVTVTQTTSDSTDSTIGDGSASGSPRVYRRARITRQRNSETKHLGNGKVTLVVGYQHSTSYRFDAPHFPEMVPLGGIFVASLLGPYPLPLASRRLAWYAGVAGTVSRLSRIAIRADTIAAELTTERTLAPEAMLMLMYRVAPSYRVFLGASYQYLRFGSLTYRAVQPEDRIPATILATLPESLELRSVHLSLGFSFTASGLIPGR